MFTKYAFVVLGVAIVLCSCGGREKEEEMMAKMLNETLVNSAKNISSSNEYIYHDFNYKFEFPGSSEKATFFKQKMDAIKFLANRAYNYIDSVRSIKNVDWVSLGKYLSNYKKACLTIDDDINSEFVGKINEWNGSFDSLSNYKSNNHFKDISEENTRVLLSKLFCDVKLLENDLIKYTNSRISNHSFTFDSYSTLVGQNVNHLKNGEELIISGGVGGFSSKAKAQITIAQKLIPVINGQAIYKLKVIGKAGKYTIPIKIEFKDEYDNRKSQIQMIEYTIDP